MPSIREFYAGRSVLVTGGTGFMGKVLLEKLLYSIPDIGIIYVLLRPKRGRSVQQRMEDILKKPLFDRIRREKPDVFSKLKGIQGDVLFEDLGLSDTIIQEMAKEVSVVFHFAATLRLEAPLKDNIDMNTKGTLRALTLAKKLKNLEMFVHLSTAFCYPDYKVLHETVYAPPTKPENVIRLLDWLDDKQLDLLTPVILGEHPNCYTYSKRLTESLILDAYNEKMPVVIARPSIVTPSHAEPMPGWVDNLNGPVGVMLGAGKGVIRTMLCDGTLYAQVIPVDTAINGIIAIAMLEATRKERLPSVPVYNVNCGHHKPTTWGEVLNIAKEYGRKYPLSWPLWYPNGDITTNPVAHEIKRVLFHLVPAYFIDGLLMILGQKRFMVRIQDRISKGLHVLQYFTLRPWNFPSPNFDGIEEQLPEEERKMFQIDLKKNDVREYMRNCVDGGKIYCLKEANSNVSVARFYHNVLFVLDTLVKIFFWLFILSLFIRFFTPAKYAFALGGPVIKALPFVGSAVFDEDS